MADQAKPEKLTLWEAIKDLGWFPLALAVIVGGPSILAILEEVFVKHQLVPALQWIVDGYNRVMAVLGAMVEPLIQPAIDWINARLNWSLTLDPVWRPLFALAMVFVLGLARAAWREGAQGQAVGVALGMGLGALLGAVLAGIVPSDGGWWAQGLRAAAPVASFLSLWGLTIAVRQINRGNAEETGPSIIFYLYFFLSTFVYAGISFALAAGLSSWPDLAAGAGVIALGWVIAVLGIWFLSLGLSGDGDRYQTRVGLTILGGFIAAGMTLAADFGLKALGAG